MNKGSYIIDGCVYRTDTATVLCEYSGLFETETLYFSQGKAFFAVTERKTDGATTAEVLSLAAAQDFLNKHCAYINTDNYIKVFGEPEQG